ncbi:hypothetical protein SLS60_000421 [Paraconiothyrium brasiliense]|uniref:Actin-like ATPase domain-containing protein n=1 Tax=Paraconiothyrium brasiliense TaxID=300254 RepID=A0ABR3S679_9PLEO
MVGRIQYSVSSDSHIWVRHSAFLTHRKRTLIESSVASIYFQNGTTVDIARIAGPYPYQFFMANASSLSQDRPNTYFCNAFSSLQYGLPGLNLPTPTNCLSPAVLAVRPLLSSLKEAVESYYGTNICFASILLDDAPFGLCQSTAGAALRSIGLTPVEIHPDHRALSATNLYVRSKMPLMAPSPDSLRDEEPLTVLALNYEPSSFNTALFLVEDELVWPVRSTITSPTVMTNSNSLAQLSALQSGLRHLIANPPYDDLFDFASPLHIDRLVLFGGSVHDTSLHSLLLNVLGANLTEEAYVDDSPFTAARAAAERALEVMQDPYFQMKDRGWWPFACQCRSGLYLTSWWDPFELAWYELRFAVEDWRVRFGDGRDARRETVKLVVSAIKGVYFSQL